METIAVSQLRANLMQVLQSIKGGKSVTITSNGKPVAKLVPPEESILNAQEELESLRKTAVLKDVLSPIESTWKASK